MISSAEENFMPARQTSSVLCLSVLRDLAVLSLKLPLASETPAAWSLSDTAAGMEGDVNKSFQSRSSV